MGELNALRTRDHAETSRQADGGDDRPTAAGDRRVREVLPDRWKADPGRSGGPIRDRRPEDARLRDGLYAASQGWVIVQDDAVTLHGCGRHRAHLLALRFAGL
jgi:hypothetical protein